MGVIKKLIGGIFAFLGGFLKGLLGLVGIGKKSEYFLEFNDSSPKPDAPALSAPAAPPKSEPAKAKPEPVKAKAEPVALASSESSNGKAPAAPVSVAPAPVATAPKAEPAPQTFAPNFLSTPSSNNGRRRPGPSLSRYMDMAKQVKPST